MADFDTHRERARHIAQNCLALRSRMLNRAVTRVYDDALRAFGITVARFNLLVAISGWAGARPADLSTALGLEKSTTSRNLKRMEADGLIELRPHPEDARSRSLHVTTAGSALLAEAFPAWEQAQARARELLGGDNPLNALETLSSPIPG